MSYKFKEEEMLHFTKIALPVLSLFFSSTSDQALMQEKDRNKIPEQYKWNLTDLYVSDEAWDQSREKLVSALPEIEKYKGKLAESPTNLLECLELVSNLGKEFDRLYSYASLSFDQDTRNQKHLAMQQKMDQIAAEFGTKTAYIEPEILKIEPSKVQEFIKTEKKLEIYRHYLEDILRRREHTGTEGEERIIAAAGLMSDAPETIYSVFSNADFPYPEITLSDGKTVKLTPSNFALYRTSSNRDDRKKVFQAFLGKLNEYRRTYGAQLNAQLNCDLFYKMARKYNSCLEAALDRNNIPTEIYHKLIENVNKHLDTFHRYLKLRKRILGIDELHYYDLYAPLLPEVELKYSYEEAKKIILTAFKPLGKEYVSMVEKAFSERWIDVYPTEGKRSGAYSNGSAYDVHPYILLNYNGKYDDVSTLAHELGHTMHSYFSNKNQPYPTSRYPIFVAEVASTFNEALLMDYVLKQIKDDKVKLSLLGNYLEGIKGTVFRQTQFAEFELKIHEMIEQGEPLTGDMLNQIYDEIVKKYYGHDKNVCIVDDEIKAEWSYIPHFYYNFYVYQYATAFTASAALSEKTLAGDKESTKKYIEFLSSGGSDYPINLLKKAGVDLTTPEPFELTMKKMNKVMDEIEKILDKMKK